jgi:hypothetical protein
VRRFKRRERRRALARACKPMPCYTLPIARTTTRHHDAKAGTRGHGSSPTPQTGQQSGRVWMTSSPDRQAGNRFYAVQGAAINTCTVDIVTALVKARSTPGASYSRVKDVAMLPNSSWSSPITKEMFLLNGGSRDRTTQHSHTAESRLTANIQL